ncbi:MAG: hypothetical protein DRQ24_10370, partial [Candidatus Latescibacterota bacterium]
MLQERKENDFSGYHDIYRDFYMPEYIVATIRKYLKGRILDVGTADGKKLRFLTEGCSIDRIVAVEPDSELIQRAKKLFRGEAVDFINERFENFEGRRGYFNVILMLEVIEHVSFKL